MSSSSSMKRRTPCSSRTSGSGPVRAAISHKRRRSDSRPSRSAASRLASRNMRSCLRSRTGIQSSTSKRQRSPPRAAHSTCATATSSPPAQHANSERSAPSRNSHSNASGGKPGTFDQTSSVSSPLRPTVTVECRSMSRTQSSSSASSTLGSWASSASAWIHCSLQRHRRSPAVYAFSRRSRASSQSLRCTQRARRARSSSGTTGQETPPSVRTASTLRSARSLTVPRSASISAR